MGFENILTRLSDLKNYYDSFLVQCNELGMHAVGIDVSSFNAFISNAKVGKYDIELLNRTVNKITERLINYTARPINKALFVSQGFHRVHSGGFKSGVKTEKYSYAEGKNEGDYYRFGSNYRFKRGKGGYGA